jgi:hypothetical protein
MKRLAWLSCLLVLLPLGRARAQTMPDLASVASDLASKIGAELIRRGPRGGDPYSVAVFPFGDSQGSYPLKLGDNGPMLRHALVDALRLILDRRAPGKFVLLFPDEVDDLLRTTKVDLSGLDGRNIPKSRAALAKLELKVGIMGRFDLKTLPAPRRDFGFLERDGSRTFPVSFERPAPRQQGVKVQATAILPDDTFDVTSGVSAQTVARHGYGPQPPVSGRLAVRFAIKVDPRKPDSDDSASIGLRG